VGDTPVMGDTTLAMLSLQILKAQHTRDLGQTSTALSHRPRTD